tara:strand:- start:1734 stop:3518 length:1785 start_codon:yes stop_codon:yes gene_type:complete
MDNLHILNLSNYNRPKIIENKNKDWINYGDDNNYYQYIIDRYNGSATNNAIINGVVNMVYGKGLDASNSNKKPDEYAQMRSIFANKDIRKTCQDLKLLGEASMQIIYKNGKVIKAEHFPRQTLRAEKCNKKGEIEAYYYHHNWSKIKPSEQPERIPAFGFGNKKTSEVIIIKRYVSGYDYYAPVDYQGGLAYAELEEEVADYLINEVQCGFSGTKVVNFNNGVPDREKQLQVKSDVLNKLTGSQGEKVIVAFNNNAESKTTIDDIPLNDAPNHYEYLSNECIKKLIIAHRITSPLLLGIKDGNSGLGNNADEIKTASLLFDNIVIKNYQELLIDSFYEILAVNDISLNLYFKTLQPLEFTEVEEIEDEETKEQETGIKMSSDTSSELSDDVALDILENLNGEEINDEWELVDEREYSNENKDIESWANQLIEEKRSFLKKIAMSIPNLKTGKGDFSVLDKSFYKVRYKYAEKYSSGNSREFCKALMQRNMVYRIEDIDAASKSGVNKSFGHKGKPYDLFRFKGGVNCGHYWSEQLYRLKKKTNGKYIKKSDKIKDFVEVESIPKTYEAKPRGWKDSKKPPKDMDNDGHHPNYKK